MGLTLRSTATILLLAAITTLWSLSASFARDDVRTTTAPVNLGGIIHADSDDTLAFTPDGNTVFFDRGEGTHKTVMVSHRVVGGWSQPQVASFSGRWFDQDPVVAPDGSYLLFNSDRPVRAGSEPLVQNYFGGRSAPGSNIWRVNRIGGRWGEPIWLGATINSDVFIDFASLARDNTLYFMRWNVQDRQMQFWRSAFVDGSYQTPERVILGDATVSLHDPAVATDQSFIVFDYGRVAGGLGRLCIAFRDGDHWGAPVDLGDEINSDIPWGAHLSPDQRTVYVTGQSGISQFLLDPWLGARGKIVGGSGGAADNAVRKDGGAQN